MTCLKLKATNTVSEVIFEKVTDKTSLIEIGLVTVIVDAGGIGIGWISNPARLRRSPKSMARAASGISG